MIPVEIVGVSDPDGDPVIFNITSVTQDEPIAGLGNGDTATDAVILGDQVLLRAERAGTGNGRVYLISFTVTDDLGQTCSGSIQVIVPQKYGVSQFPSTVSVNFPPRS
jgi:hypothetical protein